jgi:hypothetical protein
MATTYKVLGQAAPVDTANADLYTVPASTEAVISTIVVSNVTATDATCRIFVRVGGAAAAAGNALVYDGPVTANDFTAVTVGITLAATDVITVQSGTADALTFQAFGSEIA